MENSIGLEGTKAISDMLKENCYITEFVCILLLFNLGVFEVHIIILFFNFYCNCIFYLKLG